MSLSRDRGQLDPGLTPPALLLTALLGQAVQLQDLEQPPCQPSQV